MMPYHIAQGSISSLLGIEHEKKKKVKKNAHMCMTESLCGTAEIGTVLPKN